MSFDRVSYADADKAIAYLHAASKISAFLVCVVTSRCSTLRVVPITSQQCCREMFERRGFTVVSRRLLLFIAGFFSRQGGDELPCAYSEKVAKVTVV
jgi:hypothetical protein